MNDSSLRFVGLAELPNTVESFCNTPHPTAKQFDGLQESNKLQGFRDYLKVCIFGRSIEIIPVCNVNNKMFMPNVRKFQKIPEKDYLVHLVFAIIKLSAASLEHPEILATTTELYKDCYKYAQKTNQVTEKQFILNRFYNQISMKI